MYKQQSDSSFISIGNRPHGSKKIIISGQNIEYFYITEAISKNAFQNQKFKLINLVLGHVPLSNLKPNFKGLWF